MRTGRRLCGGCRLKVDGNPVIVANCHCLDSQMITGTGHSTGAMFQEAGVRLHGSVSRHDLNCEAGNTVARLFCGSCGSPLFGMNTAKPGHMTVSLGALARSDDLDVQVSIFTRSKRAWDRLADSGAEFESQPEWKPD